MFLAPSGKLMVNQSDLDSNAARGRHICEFVFKAPIGKKVFLNITYLGFTANPSKECRGYSPTNMFVKNELYVRGTMDL